MSNFSYWNETVDNSTPENLGFSKSYDLYQNMEGAFSRRAYDVHRGTYNADVERMPQDAYNVIRKFMEKSAAMKLADTAYDKQAVAGDLARACASIPAETPELAEKLLRTSSELFSSRGGASKGIAHYELECFNKLATFTGDKKVAEAYVDATAKSFANLDYEPHSALPALEKYKGILQDHPEMSDKIFDTVSAFNDRIEYSSEESKRAIYDIMNMVAKNGRGNEQTQTKANEYVNAHEAPTTSTENTLSGAVLRDLADVADGKKDLDSTVASITSDGKFSEQLKKFYHGFNRFAEVLKKNVKEEYKIAKRDNDMHHNYDMSSVVSTKTPDGKTAYMGLKEKEHGFSELLNNMGRDLKDLGGLVTGDMSVSEYNKKKLRDLHDGIRSSGQPIRAADAGVRGFVKGFKRTLDELRGTKTAPTPTVQAQENIPHQKMTVAQMRGLAPVQNPTPSASKVNTNVYSRLDEGQFMASVGKAYDLLANLEKGQCLEADRNAYYKGVMEPLMAEMAKRYPDIASAEKGSAFSGKAADYEAKMFAVMSQKSDHQDDVMRFAQWRNGKDFTMQMGNKSYSEKPFENNARYPGYDSKSATDVSLVNSNINDVRAPRVMSASEFALEKAKVAKLTIR